MHLTKTTPFAHQARIIEETKDARFFGYLMEQGTGKSHVTIAVATHLFEQGKINGLIIVAPNGVQTNWLVNEIPTHCRLTPEQMHIGIWSSTSLRKMRQFNWVANDCPAECLAVLLVNIEALRTTGFWNNLGTFSLRKYMAVVDESTIIKNPKAAQTKSALKLAKNAAYTRILTGTPITQSPLDLWSQCRFLDELALPYPSFTSFKHEFAIEETVYLGPNRPQFQKIIGYRNQDKLRELIKPFTVRILKNECLDLPEKLYQVRYVELTAEQKRIYKDLVKQSVALIEPGMVSVNIALTLILRLHQVTLGYVALDDGELSQIPHHRTEALRELIEEAPGKTIIFCRFIEDTKQVCAALPPDSFTPYHGDCSNDERSLAIKQFQEDPRIQYFVATSAAARGLTLTAAQHVVYYSQGFSLETRLQSEDRAHRIGQKNNVLYTDLVCQGTVDEKIITALKNKLDLANSVLNRDQLVEMLTLRES